MTTKKTTVKKKNEPKKNINFKKEIEKLNNKLKEKNDKLLRIIADFQNYQKRIEKEQNCREQEVGKKYIEELLSLYDLLKKAYEDKNPKDGLKLLIKNIEKFLEKEQIKPINCIGEKFDHCIHHAITILEKNDCEDNTVIEEVKKGYMLKDKVLRPSHVIVAKKIKK
jgi:molecular chaperone GrpE